ncbi:Class II abasic (AP) endonuclease [Pleurotus ostreatus]|uniref:DNA-(apurinic or apyrimidinic site) endonuclease 2 n=1 Tax=Pleurotus ostreatus TaxID=5322 RepID=A0A8H6ZXF1_PLEOS|nr:Class II abasic (AP) endonuclease [Pleurotus ostreatus]KAF7430627.1 Class II abasic (AP) endonuclease [Pleurotus ostreatus]KAJ8694941.1 Class II abasic (AP) endonuclease [Pleurotus ostreatus]
MRVLTWNINGIRTIPQYYPWNTLKDTEAILNHLGADIICFQEMKSSRQALEKSAALPSSYDAFFSFPTNKGGYSGVAVYTRKTNAVPLKVEEGLSGTLPAPKNIAVSKSLPQVCSERISNTSVLASSIALFPDVNDAFDEPQYPVSLAHLDIEGRSLTLDFGLFVLINLYCPNETSESRFPFKMNFHLMLEERVRQLTLVEGREVMVTGDINICAAPEDHCEGHIQSKPDRTSLPTEEDLSPGEGYMSKYVDDRWKGSGFWKHPAREWLRRWIDKDNGILVDVLRYFWPDRKGMYTCWNTKIGARASNYGTRIDYFLVTRGLLPWIKSADISPEIKGSDHCPVWLELHDEIQVTDHNGSQRTLLLREMMQQTLDRTREPPWLASKWWDEYSGKQKLLSAFFQKGDTARSLANPSSSGGIQGGESPSPTSSQNGSTISTSKRKLTINSLHAVNSTSGKQKRPKTARSKTEVNQAKLSNFFSLHTQGTSSASAQEVAGDTIADTEEQIDADYQYALSLSQEPSQERASGKNSKAAWSNIMAPIKPPKCLIHGELATEYTVNKPGPNKGKKFFICSRPVGPGYDKGRSERNREDVDPQWRCNFFKWSSQVRREMDLQRKS